MPCTSSCTVSSELFCTVVTTNNQHRAGWACSCSIPVLLITTLLLIRYSGTRRLDVLPATVCDWTWLVSSDFGHCRNACFLCSYVVLGVFYMLSCLRVDSSAAACCFGPPSAERSVSAGSRPKRWAQSVVVSDRMQFGPPAAESSVSARSRPKRVFRPVVRRPCNIFENDSFCVIYFELLLKKIIF